MNNLITSSGVIKNREKPRIGVLHSNGERIIDDWFDDVMNNGIDLTFEEYLLDLKDQGKTEEEIEELCDCYESDQTTWLFGDAWIKDQMGKYIIDKTGTFAATYNNYDNCITIEYSKYTRLCHHTSPCYVMADGSGPCGDLDTEGDAILAYDLPPDFYK